MPLNRGGFIPIEDIVQLDSAQGYIPTEGIFNFLINNAAILNEGDTLEFQFILEQSTDGNSFTAVLQGGQLVVGSTSPTTGYIATECPYLYGGIYGEINANGEYDNKIAFTTNVTNFYGNEYRFEPNPLGGTPNRLYPYYGDTVYPFNPTTNDVLIMQVSDSTYYQANILAAGIDPATQLLTLTLDKNLPSRLIDDIVAVSQTYKRLIVVKRYEDEQNVILQYKKPPGDTSYGFLIPETISEEVLLKINTLQSSVQTQLLSTQANTGLG